MPAPTLPRAPGPSYPARLPQPYTLELTLSFVHTFAGNPLDRADTRRRDPEWLARAAVDPATRYLPFWQLNVLTITRNGGAGELGWLSAREVQELTLETPLVFLGCGDGAAHFAIDVSELGDPAHEIGLDERAKFEDCRAAAMHLDTPSTGIVAQGRAQIDWHRRHRFCSVCGARTEQDRGGHVRRCGECKAEHFPRTDPVAIMLVVDGERCLLGQPAGRLARSGFYSTLAGFVDQGESIEEAVRREVREEAGIHVGEVRYHSSQPWPFPSSLMIGCHARAESFDIQIDTNEMSDVSWFSRDDIRRSLANEHPDLKVPGAIAIAHHLVRAWAAGEVAL
jgi:NAD+ diphosphatase